MQIIEAKEEHIFHKLEYMRQHYPGFSALLCIMTQIETIVFDLGGVLIDWNPRYLYQKMFDSEEEMEKFLSEVCHSRWNAQHDAGKPFQEGIDELAEKYPQYKAEIQAYFDRWIEMIGGEITGTSDLFHTLADSGHYRMLALTNWSHETFPLVVNEYQFFKKFEGVVVSGEEKLIKPDAAFYELLLERYQVTAPKALFIDDNKDNIEAAAKLGFQVIHFHSPEQLKQELASLGLISDQAS